MARYLVTGGAGFIGSNIVDELVRRREEVRVLDDFSSGKRENLERISGEIELIEGDIRDFALLKKALRGCDYVIHQAALRSVPKSLKNPQLYDEVNVKGTLNVLIASHENKVKRVVFASSSSLYGDTTKLPQSEDQIPQPISPYAATKLAGEHYCRVFAKSYGLETVALRYFNVFGPRQSLESEYAVVIPKFITCMLGDEHPPVDGDGKQSRDFTYVDNVVDANLTAAARDGVSGEVFNVACGKAYNLLELVKIVNEILSKNIEPKFMPPRPGDVKHTLADVTKMRKLLKFDPKIDFVLGLRKTIEYFRSVGEKG
ncbi:MAG: Vi polysaccharide biosynthesis protein VipB/TviC [Omnitrophica WOR_2 bacterium RIFCSPHIGHO2_01_FULL_49_10]|nr:MAG: Vi polysaccharide biosynthesis protein VipB/TviC [Omnitrophica WOR_2 bacterium RIFCSPHIGHO2_01_FULL_49_10]